MNELGSHLQPQRTNVRILIADDHTLFLEGLERMLGELTWVTIVATAKDGAEVLRKLHAYYVDIVLLDIHMPGDDGIKTAEMIRSRHPDVKIIIVSMYSERTFIERSYRLGVHGYLLKNTSSAEVLKAIETVRLGGRYFAHDVTAAILGESVGLKPRTHGALTKRETDVLALIAKGLNTVDIARHLHLSPQTVSTHRKNIMQKLNVGNAAALVRYAITEGLVQ